MRRIGGIAAATAALWVGMPEETAFAHESAGTMSLSVGGTARLSNGGQTFTIPVTVTCTPLAGFVEDTREALLFVSQRRGQATVNGEGGGSFLCDGAAHTFSWTATALAGQRIEERFHGGKATVSAFALVCGTFPDTHGACMQAGPPPQTVRVRG